ncbi:MAG: hypothetical protein EZS26_000322 [Candidatus Ordinivivax streblomastigis]|uniref:Uncharacterized protein n=1 Tax=Candidatus Ordinivivax streblomastigis TaxID=2540710 RepID=A0A5M8P5R2_9BACT|nr:MAG: hypothetical protein EZS26_000322 [Candidatus Ordinivivax streblomastigis]
MQKTHNINRIIASFYIVLMSIAIVPIEGYGVSNLKVAALTIAPLILFFRTPRLSKVILLTILYYLLVFFSAYLVNHDSFRASTIIYLGMFLLMFVMYYNLIYFEHAFSIIYFLKLIKFVIYAFTICLILQQIAVLLGAKYVLGNFLNIALFEDNPFRLNSLAIEPSHSARVMGAWFLALLKINEYKVGRKLSLKEIYKGNKWIILGFLYSMITMGSGTAFVVLAILSLYFIHRRYVLVIVPAFVLLYISSQSIDFEPLDRAKKTFEASLTGDAETVIKADASAAFRVIPIINTFKSLNLFSSATWFGNGTDSTVFSTNIYDTMDTKGKIGMINEYGLLSYIVLLIFVFSCTIRKFFSIETLLFFVLLAGTIGNVAYPWGVLMIFSTIKYFNNQHKKLKCHL